ncbi:LD-carboxypeptidase [Candidatus Kaiserbacteria bacterium]|nr:LD-carboxypeptidase [Candidatus Kaiserbacteria bacterium]
MTEMRKLPKLQKGDKVAILSPSFAAPGKWPQVYELGLTRVREVFGLDPVEFPTTKKIGASGEERAKDIIDAFTNPEIKAVITTLGGNDQVTYIKNLPAEPFVENPKPFFGYSDNSHFCNFLFLNGIPSYYGASLFTQFAIQGEMDAYTVEYINHALFDEDEFEIRPSEEYNDKGLDWNNTDLLGTRRTYWLNEGWHWDGEQSAEGLLWGGCIESVDEMLRHGVPIPTLEQFTDIVLMLESSEEIPPAQYVSRILRALGERGILKQVKGVLVGRPKAWEFDKQNTDDEKKAYRAEQREIVLKTVRAYNVNIPIVQNLDFGHTDPQLPMPYGGKVRIDSEAKKIFADF